MIDLADKHVYVRDLVFGLYVGPRVAYRRGVEMIRGAFQRICL